MMNMGIALILGVVGGIALTVWLYRAVLPAAKDGSFEKPVYQLLHDYFHFKKLYLEDVLRALFVLGTAMCVGVGAFLLLGYTGYGYYKVSTFLPGLMTLVLGPVALRLTYEGIMMFLLLVKNTIEINNKLSAGKNAD